MCVYEPKVTRVTNTGERNEESRRFFPVHAVTSFSATLRAHSTSRLFFYLSSLATLSFFLDAPFFCYFHSFHDCEYSNVSFFWEISASTFKFSRSSYTFYVEFYTSRDSLHALTLTPHYHECSSSSSLVSLSRYQSQSRGRSPPPRQDLLEESTRYHPNPSEMSHSAQASLLEGSMIVGDASLSKASLESSSAPRPPRRNLTEQFEELYVHADTPSASSTNKNKQEDCKLSDVSPTAVTDLVVALDSESRDTPETASPVHVSASHDDDATTSCLCFNWTSLFNATFPKHW